MQIDSGWEALSPDDPEPLRQALTLIQGTNADALARLAPVQPPTIEKKGMLGRTKQVAVAWGGTFVHWSDENGVGEYNLALEMVPGPPLAQRVGLPAGVTVPTDDGTTAAVVFDETMSPASVAACVAQLLPVVFGAAVPSGWQVCVDDNNPSFSD